MLHFLQIILKVLHTQNIPYMLSGSVAMNIYILPRSTRDFDFVVNLQLNNIEALHTFKEGYCEEDAVKEAVKHRGMFNIIDHASGFKADLLYLKMNHSGRRNSKGGEKLISLTLLCLWFLQKIFCFLN